MSSYRSRLKSLTFPVWSFLDRFGLHVLPKHFYTPVPDLAWLRANRHLWGERSELVGIHWNADEQLAWLRGTCAPFIEEVAGLRLFEQWSASETGPGYGAIESQVLHAVVRRYRPRRIVEIGSGTSTAAMLHALSLNEADGSTPAEFVSVEPFPRAWLTSDPRVRLVRDYAQAVPLEVFATLGEGDMLFVDSTHSVKTGSDVVRIYTEIIPRLNPGVIIHSHDNFLPYQHDRAAWFKYFGWQESVLIQALLIGNPRLRVLASLPAMHYDRTEALKMLLPDYEPQEDDGGLQVGTYPRGHFPTSLWLEVTDAPVTPGATPQ